MQTRQDLPQGNLVKITKIPVVIQDHPQEMTGLARFSTENPNSNFLPVTSKTTLRKNFIPYRSYEDDEVKRGKEVKFYEVEIGTRLYKNKKFKLEMPIQKSSKSTKSSKSDQIHFTFNFCSSEGVITLMNGLYEGKAEFSPREGAPSYQERMEQQLARLDNRRKEEPLLGYIE